MLQAVAGVRVCVWGGGAGAGVPAAAAGGVGAGWVGLGGWGRCRHASGCCRCGAVWWRWGGGRCRHALTAVDGVWCVVCGVESGRGGGR